jgi:hypothetical protein
MPNVPNFGRSKLGISIIVRVLAGLLAGFLTLMPITQAQAQPQNQAPSQRSSPALPALPVSHSVLTSLLRDYVRPRPDGINRVDFAQFKATGRDRLKSYIDKLERAAPSRMPARAQMAFWINLYNAKSLQLVLDRYPVASIRDIRLPDPSGKPADGPWKANVTTIEGRTLSLDDIATKILRPQFRDPRIRYALNCLALGCPNLLPEAYTPDRIEQQLDNVATTFVNHPRGITIKGGRVEASNLYEWHEAEFGGFRPVMAHLSHYAKPELRRQLATVSKFDSYVFDWRLNDAARR